MTVALDPLGPLVGEAAELYLTFAETPFDTLPAGYKDGDNSVLASTHGDALRDALAARLAVSEAPPSLTVSAVPRRVIVPHPRDLKLKMHGTDVLALQRALSAAHLRQWGNFSQAFGQGVLAQVKEFQHAHGIRATGVYGEGTHRALAQYYDARGIWLLTQLAAKTALQQRRARMLAGFMVAYNFRDRLHYTEGSLRWYLIANHVRHEQIPALAAGYGDCSAFATWSYWDVGAPDPNQLNYTGGYTGTLGVHGTVIDAAKAQVGALFLYEPQPHAHVQISVGGENTIGFGSEQGPLYLPAGYRSDLNVVRQYPGLA